MVRTSPGAHVMISILNVSFTFAVLIVLGSQANYPTHCSTSDEMNECRRLFSRLCSYSDAQTTKWGLQFIVFVEQIRLVEQILLEVNLFSKTAFHMTRIYFCSDLIDFDKETIIDRTVDSTTFLRSYSGGADSFFDIVNSSSEMRVQPQLSSEV